MSNEGASDQIFWNFGFGSNMDPHYVQEKKQVTVEEHIPAVLRDYKLMFNFPGYPLVEPAFASVQRHQGEEVHGVAYRMKKESFDRMNALEPAEYRREMVSLEAYDGRTLQAQIYTVDDSLPEDEPSQRYLDIIISGATKAGLKDDYIQKLRARPVYTPPHWVLKVREKRPKLSELKPITVEELSKHKTDGDVWYSVLGYVVNPEDPGWFKMLRGRDITAILLRHFRKLGIDWDDGGKPPYPLVKDMSKDELEYLTRFLDYYHAGSSQDGETDMGEIVGCLEEFKEQQDKGETDFFMPEHGTQPCKIS